MGNRLKSYMTGLLEAAEDVGRVDLLTTSEVRAEKADEDKGELDTIEYMRGQIEFLLRLAKERK